MSKVKDMYEYIITCRGKEYNIKATNTANAVSLFRKSTRIHCPMHKDGGGWAGITIRLKGENEI